MAQVGIITVGARGIRLHCIRKEWSGWRGLFTPFCRSFFLANSKAGRTESRDTFTLSRRLTMLIWALLMTLMTAAAQASPWDGRPASDLSGYASFSEIEGEIMLSDTTVAELASLMEGKETFAFYAGYADCPWCNLLLPGLNSAAVEAGERIGYLNTRANPEWENNTEIDDYDLFLRWFGAALEPKEDEEDEEKKHLSVPMVFFIREGEIAAVHSGVVEGPSSPYHGLTEYQAEKLRNNLMKKFAAMR